MAQILVISILLMLPLVSGAADYYATSSGDLQSAINAAQPGDRVVLKAGSYKGHYDTVRDGTPDAPIIIESETKWGASILATGANSHLIDVKHSYITVRYIQFDGVIGKYNEQNAIRVRGQGKITEGVIVEKNSFTGCNAACAHFQDTRRAIVRFNRVDGTGIYTPEVYPGEVFYISKAGGGLAGKEILIYGNEIVDANGECFDLKEDSDTIDIHHNICTSVQKDSSSDPRVITGLFSNQGASNVYFTDNILRDYNTTPPSWTGAFMLFGGSSDVDIGNNVVRDGTHGKVTASPGGALSRIKIHDNTFCNLNNYDTSGAVESGDVTFSNNAGYHPGSGASAEVCDAETNRIESEIALLPDSEFIRGGSGTLEDGVNEALKDVSASCDQVSCPGASASGSYHIGGVHHHFCLFECVSVCDSKGKLRQYYFAFRWERQEDACFEEIGEILDYGEYPYLCNPDDAPKCEVTPAPTPVPTHSLYVAPDGDGTACTAEVPCSLGTGLRQVREKGAIVFLDGEYPRFDTPRDDVTFLAMNKHQAIILNESGSSPVHALNCQHSGIVVDGLRVSGNYTGGANHGVVRGVGGCNTLTLRNMHIEKSAGELMNWGGTNPTNLVGLLIEDSIIEGGGYANKTAEGVYLGRYNGENRATDIIIRRNIFRDFGDNGIDCKPGCANVEVYHNLFERQKTNGGEQSTTDGAVVVQGTNVYIHDNIFRDNDLSREGGSSVARLTLKGTRFENNVLTRNRHNGPLIRTRADGEGELTRIEGNTSCGNSNETIAGGFNLGTNAFGAPQSACDAEVQRVMNEIGQL